MPATDQTTDFDPLAKPAKAGLGDVPNGTEALTEVGRLMTVCNSCRYCEGLCAVFPAMIARRDFPDGDLNYMANLCHGCGACFYDCQFSPPHQFDVNVPRAMARARTESYQAYTWPRMFAGLFARNGLAISIIAALSVAVFIAGFAAWMIVNQHGNTALYVPFYNGPAIELGPFYFLFAAFVIVAFGNAVNLTDGLDGLATMPVITS